MKNLALKYKSIAVQALYLGYLPQRNTGVNVIQADHTIFTTLWIRNTRHTEEKNAWSGFSGEPLAAQMTTHILA